MFERMFAEDTNIHVTLSARNTTDFKSDINPELSNLNCWLKANKLSLNTAKTEFMIRTATIGARFFCFLERYYYCHHLAEKIM